MRRIPRPPWPHPHEHPELQESADRRARPDGDGPGRAPDLRGALRRRPARRAAAAPADVPAVLRRLRGRRVLVLRALRIEVALRLAARSVQYRAGLDGAGLDAAGGGLPAGVAAALRLLLLRQDRHRSLLAPTGLPARGASPRLSLRQILALALDAGPRGHD